MPSSVAGDALDLLPCSLARAPEGQPVCVYHTMVVYQFSPQMREALDNILTKARLRRPIWRLGLEGTLQGENHLTLGRYSDGAKQVRTLALCHPHGRWMDWRA